MFKGITGRLKEGIHTARTEASELGSKLVDKVKSKSNSNVQSASAPSLALHATSAPLPSSNSFEKTATHLTHVPSPCPAPSSSSYSSSPSYRCPAGLSETELRQQLVYYPTDYLTVETLFELLKGQDRGKDASDAMKDFAEKAYARDDDALASHCYVIIAELWSQFGTSAAAYKFAAQMFENASIIDPLAKVDPARAAYYQRQIQSAYHTANQYPSQPTEELPSAPSAPSTQRTYTSKARPTPSILCPSFDAYTAEVVQQWVSEAEVQAAYTTFESLIQQGRDKDACDFFSAFAFRAIKTGNQAVGGRCYAHLAEYLTQQSTTIAEQQCAYLYFKLAAETDSSQAPHYHQRTYVVEAKIAELAQQPTYEQLMTSYCGTLPYQTPTGLSESILRQQLKQYPTDNITANALFGLLKTPYRLGVARYKEASDFMLDFADKVRKKDRSLAKECYHEVAKLWDQSHSIAGQQYAIQLYKMLGKFPGNKDWCGTCVVHAEQKIKQYAQRPAIVFSSITPDIPGKATTSSSHPSSSTPPVASLPPRASMPSIAYAIAFLSSNVVTLDNLRAFDFHLVCFNKGKMIIPNGPREVLYSARTDLLPELREQIESRNLKFRQVTAEEQVEIERLIKSRSPDRYSPIIQIDGELGKALFFLRQYRDEVRNNLSSYCPNLQDKGLKKIREDFLNQIDKFFHENADKIESGIKPTYSSLDQLEFKIRMVIRDLINLYFSGVITCRNEEFLFINSMMKLLFEIADAIEKYPGSQISAKTSHDHLDHWIEQLICRGHWKVNIPPDGLVNTMVAIYEMPNVVRESLLAKNALSYSIIGFPTTPETSSAPSAPPTYSTQTSSSSSSSSSSMSHYQSPLGIPETAYPR